MIPVRPRAFTLIELLVVVSIIAVLAGLIIGATSLLLTNSKRVRTHHQLSQITVAMDRYMKEFPLLGNVADATSSDFCDAPWLFLGGLNEAAGVDKYDPYIDLGLRDLADADDSPASSQELARKIRDGSGMPFAWRCENGPGGAGGHRYTRRLLIWSTINGEASRYVAGEGTWTDGRFDALRWW